MNYTVHGILQARILEWVAFPFSRGVFPTQGSDPGLLHCRQILNHLSHQGSTLTSIMLSKSSHTQKERQLYDLIYKADLWRKKIGTEDTFVQGVERW